ncbi:MAG: class I SAM-dependent methyltransferase, partial [Candidatus Thiodiazotropha sp.]
DSLVNYLRTDQHIYIKMIELLEKYVLPHKKSLSIVEIGCGTGSFLEHLINRVSNFSYTGIDISKKVVEISREMFPDKSCEFIVGDVQAPIDRRFKVAVVKDVFEHLSNPETAIESFLNLTNEWGVLAFFNTREDSGARVRLGEEYCFHCLETKKIESIFVKQKFSIVHRENLSDLEEAARKGLAKRSKELAQYQIGYPSVYIVRRSQ